MCIPCVMCGACFDEKNADALRGFCPECGNPLLPDTIACPACYTFLGSMLKQPTTAGEKSTTSADTACQPLDQ